MNRRVAGLVAALAVASLVGQPSASTAQSTAPSFEQVLEAARREAKLVAWVLLPAQPATHRAVIDAFNKRFELNAKVDWVPTSPNNANPRVIAEAHGGKISVDLIGGALDEVAELVKAGVVKPYAWSQVFGGVFPKILDLEAQMAPEYRGTALPFLDVHYGLAWNSNSIKDDEVPSRLTDLVDPKWQGKFGLNSIFFVPLPIVSADLGAERTISLAQQFYANKPVLSRGTPAVAQSVVNGAVPIGVTIFPVAETGIRANQPLKFKLFADYVPVSPVHLYVPEASPNPNMARLFAAWFAAEGYRIADKFEPNPQSTDRDNKVTQMTEQQVTAGAKVVKIRSADDLATAAKVREAIGLMLSGQK